MSLHATAGSSYPLPAAGVLRAAPTETANGQDSTGGLPVVLVGESSEGTLLRALVTGLQKRCAVTIIDPYATPLSISSRARLLASRRSNFVEEVVLEATRQLRPAWVLLVKGRWISNECVREMRAFSRVATYYPDNPFWRWQDRRDALGRLAASDIRMLFSRRLAREVAAVVGGHCEVIPFGYDPSSFPLRAPAPDRRGIAFVGAWSVRRQRYLSALEGLDLTVAGPGWPGRLPQAARGEVTGLNASAILGSALVGVNLLNPQCAGATNMRTWEIMASGAMQVTDPGVDCSPFVDGETCLWFESPEDLRLKVEDMLRHPELAVTYALGAQALASSATYDERASRIVTILERV